MAMKSSVLLFTLVFFISQAKEIEHVTCGSVLKLVNVDYKVRLHSHDVKYGTGSGQQSVTGTPQQEDVNSHWVVKAETKKNCIRGAPIRCGQVIRLQHLATGKNLHSHIFHSPLSDNQEVSAYGVNGEGDSGDHWMVVCDYDKWLFDDEVMFKHVDTDVYLGVSGRQYGSPINGQMEVVGFKRISSARWKAAEGVYIHSGEYNPREENHVHTEL